MSTCERCKQIIVSLFEKDDISYYHCNICHSNYHNNHHDNKLIEIKKIVSVTEEGLFNKITPEYSPLKRAQKTFLSENNELVNKTNSSNKCVFCSDLKTINENYVELLYSRLFLDDDF
jgi:hypothetical protein